MEIEEKTRVDSLGFRPELIRQIMSGQKNNTWRVWPDKYVVLGDTVKLINQETGEVFGHAQIMEKCEKMFRDLNEGDRRGHETFDSDEEMYQYYSDYYKMPVNEGTTVTVIKFTFI